MDISGLVQSYGPGAPQYGPFYPQIQQNNLFSFGARAGFWSDIPVFANYIQQRPLPYLTQYDNDRGQGMSFARNTGQDFVEEFHNQSQPIKSETQWSGPENLPSFDSANTKNVPTSPTNRGNEANPGTEVDTLMKAIQAKSTQQTTSSVDQSRPVVRVSRAPPYV